MKKIVIILSLVFAFSSTSNASHFMGGEITVTHISGNDYLVVLTAFRDMNGITFSQTSQMLDAYDSSGNSSTIFVDYHANSIHPLYGLQAFTQVPNMAYPVEMDMWYDTVSIPTGTKYLTWGSCCRNSTILNGAANEGFTLLAEVTIGSINNSSPVFLSPPVLVVPHNVAWQYNPLPFDIDGDSLAWSFTDPYDGIFGVLPPSTISITAPPSDPTNVLRIDSITGQIDWTASQQGNYVMTIKCEEFRNGVKIGEINRDMQYIVIPDSLVMAPTVLNMSTIPTNSGGYPYIVSQPNQNISFSLMVDNSANNVSMEAYGEPFQINNIATFTTSTSGNNIEGTFDWSPTQSEERINPYFVVVRSTNGSYSLDETIQIEVSSVTSVNDFIVEKFNIYPNPTSDEFYIDISLDKSAEISVVVYDLLGKKVQTFSTEKGIGKHLLKSDFNLESGQYIISVEKDNVELKSEKLLITK
ncbi:MAG: T9SS type A sorting domain-containing protein [Flavobacteriales bacterium]|nr:T9SS type A sorting domain-containing protein [Flavobacteriales bacterium]